MKRTVITLAGVMFGLFLTWFCLYTFSHIQWPQSNRPVKGCHELGKCSVPWWTMLELYACVFGPSILFGLLNTVAWKRWTVQKWSTCFAITTFCVVVFYLYGYAVPA